MIGASIAVRPPRSRGPVLMMIDALRRIGGNLWMVDNAYTGAFVDNVGTTPVTAYADLLGLTTDRLGVLGVNLVTTPSVTGAAVDGVTAVLPYPVGFGMTVGKTYRCTYTVSGFSGSLDVGFASGSFSAVTGATRVSANGTYSFTATAVNQDINVFTRPISNTANFSNVAVRELTGNHASQSAVASKPSVQRVPKRTRGPVNQLLWSGDFSNAAWTKAGATTASNATTINLPNLNESIFQEVAVSALVGTTATTGFLLSGTGTVYIGIARRGSGTYEQTLLKVTLSATPTVFVATHTIVNAGQTGFVPFVSRATDGTATTVTCGGAALFSGVVTAQQIIDNGGIPLTTTTALPNVLEWANVISFDGSNDFLQTGITTGNEGWVCAGVAHNVAATAIVFSGGGENATQAGAALRMAGGPTGCQLMLSDGVTGQVTQSPVTTVAPGTPFVYEGGWDASTRLVGVNGAITSAAKTINCASSLQSRIGGSVTGGLPLNGPMHAIAYTPVLPSAADRATIRDGIAALQGRTL